MKITGTKTVTKIGSMEIVIRETPLPNCPKGLYSVDVNGETILECMGADDIEELTVAEAIQFYADQMADMARFMEVK